MLGRNSTLVKTPYSRESRSAICHYSIRPVAIFINENINHGVFPLYWRQALW